LTSFDADVDALNVLGCNALATGEPDRAVAIFGQAILSAPLDPHTHVNMAAAYLALNRLGDALAHAKRAVKLAPSLAQAHHNLGNTLFLAGDADGAVAAFSAARALNLDEEAHWSNFLFAQTFSEEADSSAIFAENRAWGRRLERQAGTPPRPAIADPDPDRVLSLAYALPELSEHVTPRFLAPVLAAHDRDRFHVSLYGHRAGGGPPPDLLVPPGVRWIDTYGVTAADIAASMRHDRIDVLIHPCTFRSRLRPVLAYRGAPLQMAGINFVSSTGLTATDYLLSDATLTPPATSAAYFTERLIMLPSFNCYGIPPGAPEVTPLPAHRNGFVRFGSFNAPSKFGAQTVETWSEVLRRVPTSRLLLKHRVFEDATVRGGFIDRFAAGGVASDRIEFSGFTAEVRDYLGAYGDVDIVLDAMPFNGGTTSYEAIWMGVPVLTLAGDLLMARQSASLMRAVGHPEFITNSKQAYVDKALGLSQDLDHLSEVRSALRARAARTLFDAVRYTRTLEDAVRTAWRELVAGQAD
jgi:predicted O-linked N-acetylglucosamine transferase (SPINDLY family)